MTSSGPSDARRGLTLLGLLGIIAVVFFWWDCLAGGVQLLWIAARVSLQGLYHIGVNLWGVGILRLLVGSIAVGCGIVAAAHGRAIPVLVLIVAGLGRATVLSCPVELELAYSKNRMIQDVVAGAGALIEDWAKKEGRFPRDTEELRGALGDVLADASPYSRGGSSERIPYQAFLIERSTGPYLDRPKSPHPGAFHVAVSPDGARAWLTFAGLEVQAIDYPVDNAGHDLYLPLGRFPAFLRKDAGTRRGERGGDAPYVYSMKRGGNSSNAR